MRPLGYMYKRVAARPDWLAAPSVVDIYALSGCVSEDFADYINFWKHNGYWLFDSPTVMQELAQANALSLEGMKLFYYEARETEYDDQQNAWLPYAAEPSFETAVVVPAEKTLEGYDVTTFAVHTSPECSPLSCNALATDIPTNEHCLFRTAEEAVRAVESGAFKSSEPGPYRVIAVYSPIVA